MGRLWSTVPKPIAVVFIGLVYSIFRPFFQLWLELNQTSAKYIRRNGEKIRASTFGWGKPSNCRPSTSLADKEMLTFFTKLFLSGALGKIGKLQSCSRLIRQFFPTYMLVQTLGRHIFRPDFILWSSKVGFCKFKSLLPVSKRWSIELPWN